MLKPLDEGCRPMKTPYQTLHAKPRELCKCKRGPVNPEYEVCESCYLNAQADVIDLDEARKFKALERLMAGDEG